MLHKNTTTKELFDVLNKLMEIPALQDFRLVGGTALSLLQGHRMSDDIDLFSHLPYGSVDFKKIEADIRLNFAHVYNKLDIVPEIKALPEHIWITLQVGESSTNSVKVDIMNTPDPFLDKVQVVENIRLTSLRDIALMKLEVVSSGGRKKDFWDLAEIFEHISLSDLLAIYPLKYPYNSVADVQQGLTNFSKADSMPDPVCLKNNTWEEIKKNMANKSEELSKKNTKQRGLGL